MKLTTKGRYAVMAMADLASNEDIKPVSLNEIATRQNISLSYLEQLFFNFKNNCSKYERDIFCLIAISFKLTGLMSSLEAKSAMAITAYRPFVVNFILFQCYLTIISLFLLKQSSI